MAVKISVILLTIVVILLDSWQAALAAGFSGDFSATVEPRQPGAHPVIRFTISHDKDSTPFRKLILFIPAGFEIDSLENLKGVVGPNFQLDVAFGDLCILDNCQLFKVFNVYDRQGYKALWRMHFGQAPSSILVPVEGSVEQGHTLTIEWPENFARELKTPLALNFYINGKVPNFLPEQSLVWAPRENGEYTFGIELNSVSNEVFSDSFNVEISGQLVNEDSGLLKAVLRGFAEMAGTPAAIAAKESFEATETGKELGATSEPAISEVPGGVVTTPRDSKRNFVILGIVLFIVVLVIVFLRKRNLRTLFGNW